MPREFTTARARERVRTPAVSLKVLFDAGVIRPHSPVALAKVVQTLRTWGMGLAGGFHCAALLHAERLAIIDDLGELTFAEIDARSNALADSLSRRGIGAGDSVAILIRNHRGFLDASLAVAKLGCDALYLNTAFAAPQLGEVCEREKPSLIIYDQEFTGLIDRADIAVQRMLAWVEEESDLEDLETLIGQGSPRARKPPERPGKSVILTSGTTGTPKGAPRGGGNLGAAVALLSRMPLKARWRTHIAAPAFHTWGWAHLNLAMLLGSTVVLTRTFDPERALALVDRHRCSSLVVIPVMLQRILWLPQETLDRYTLDSLQVVAASGSSLPGGLAQDWMDQYGDTLYNIYGSTEVAWVSIAQPAEMRRAPGTAGMPPINTVVRLYDDDGREVAPGQPGRIFVGNSMLFEGYSGGGHKDRIDGLMSSGDVGRFDESGLLFVEGRDDEMIVSGGENVFPQEVEDVLSRHDRVTDVAAIGVDDEEFGRRLRAFVVLTEGAGGADESGTTRPDAALVEELKAHVKENLARYKVPRDFVFLDELPRNATGKVLKRVLAEHEIDAGPASGDGAGRDEEGDR